MSSATAIVHRAEEHDAGQMTAIQVRSQVNLVQQVMREVMQDGQHYGTIPGCGNKPTLLKPGAEKLGMCFRLSPEFNIQIDHMADGHREYRITCTLTHIDSGKVMGQGVGSGSTMETKYRYRGGERKCPECGKATIIAGKKEYGGGFICFGKKGGCGAKFTDNDPKITSQQIGRVENPDIADCYNTVLKMAKKRAQVDAILTVTAASDIFTQDIEDLPLGDAPPAAPAPAHVSDETRTWQNELSAAFEQAGIDEANQKKAVGMACQKYKVKTLDAMDNKQWANFIAAIKAGKCSNLPDPVAKEPKFTEAEIPGTVLPPTPKADGPDLSNIDVFYEQMLGIAAAAEVPPSVFEKMYADLKNPVNSAIMTGPATRQLSARTQIWKAAKAGKFEWATGKIVS
jgi:hypothetical protein